MKRTEILIIIFFKYHNFHSYYRQLQSN